MSISDEYEQQSADERRALNEQIAFENWQDAQAIAEMELYENHEIFR